MKNTKDFDGIDTNCFSCIDYHSHDHKLKKVTKKTKIGVKESPMGANFIDYIDSLDIDSGTKYDICYMYFKDIEKIRFMYVNQKGLDL